MTFPSAVESSGVPLYSLRCCSSLFAAKQQHLSSQEVEDIQVFLLLALNNIGAPFPY